jgi:hypothetical protein
VNDFSKTVIPAIEDFDKRLPEKEA